MHKPGSFESYVADVEPYVYKTKLALLETSGQEEYERLRRLSYSDSHMILISHSIDYPGSLGNIAEKV